MLPEVKSVVSTEKKVSVAQPRVQRQRPIQHHANEVVQVQQGGAPVAEGNVHAAAHPGAHWRQLHGCGQGARGCGIPGWGVGVGQGVRGVLVAVSGAGGGCEGAGVGLIPSAPPGCEVLLPVGVVQGMVQVIGQGAHALALVHHQGGQVHKVGQASSCSSLHLSHPTLPHKVRLVHAIHGMPLNGGSGVNPSPVKGDIVGGGIKVVISALTGREGPPVVPALGHILLQVVNVLANECSVVASCSEPGAQGVIGNGQVGSLGASVRVAHIASGVGVAALQEGGAGGATHWLHSCVVDHVAAHGPEAGQVGHQRKAVLVVVVVQVICKDKDNVGLGSSC